MITAKKFNIQEVNLVAKFGKITITQNSIASITFNTTFGHTRLSDFTCPIMGSIALLRLTQVHHNLAEMLAKISLKII